MREGGVCYIYSTLWSLFDNSSASTWCMTETHLAEFISLFRLKILLFRYMYAMSSNSQCLILRVGRSYRNIHLKSHKRVCSGRQESIKLINQDSSSQPGTFSELNQIPTGNESAVEMPSCVSVCWLQNGDSESSTVPLAAVGRRTDRGRGSARLSSWLPVWRQEES